MPRLAQSNFEEDVDVDTSEARQCVAQATPPSRLQQGFRSKADLIKGIMGDDIPDHDFMDESDDSDLEIYGQTKRMRQAHPVSSVADADEEESYREESQVSRPIHRDADVQMHTPRDDDSAAQEVGPRNATVTRELVSPLKLHNVQCSASQSCCSRRAEQS